MSKDKKINLLEIDLEDLVEKLLEDEPETLSLLPGILMRQFVLKGYGKIDLLHLSFHKEYDWTGKKTVLNNYLEITVIELKRDKLSYNEVGQLARYMKGIKNYYDGLKEVLTKGFCIRVKGILIGKTIDAQSDFVYMMNYMGNDIDLYTYELNYKTGLEFEYKSFMDYFNPGQEIESTKLDFLKSTYTELKEIYKHDYEIKKLLQKTEA